MRIPRLLASARKLTITGSWAALFTLQHYVSRIEAEGARMHIPAEMPPTEPAADSSNIQTVGEMVANGAVLRSHARRRNEIERTAAAPFTFTFAKLKSSQCFENKSRYPVRRRTSPSLYHRSLLLTSGSGLRSWPKSRYSGRWVRFVCRMEDSEHSDGIDGTLSANGKFNGILQKVHVSGHTDVPDFRVKRHRVRLQTDYSSDGKWIHR